MIGAKQKVFYKSFFKDKTREQIKQWIKDNKKQLVGSAIFTRGTTFGAKLVTWAEGWTCPDKKGFIPSHTGSIVEWCDDILIFDMKPPKACTQSLEKYLWTTKEDFILLLRDFSLDRNMFSRTVLDHNGQKYPYMSALRSVFTKRQTQWNCHCSELHLRKLQMQGIYTDVNAEITPDELMHVMLRGEG